MKTGCCGSISPGVSRTVCDQNSVALKIVLFGAAIQVANSYVIKFLNPYLAFALIYSLATLVFFIWNLPRLKSLLKFSDGFSGVVILLLGQVISPYLYFKGVFLADLFTQSLVYMSYPLVVLLVSGWGFREEIGRRERWILGIFVTAQFGFLLQGTLQKSPGIWYLLASVVALLAHKVLHQWHVKKVGPLNEGSLSFYGLLCASLLGLVLAGVRGEGDALQGVFSAINSSSFSGVIFFALLSFLVMAIPYLQYSRNRFLNQHSFFFLYSWSLLTPVVAILFNNALLAVDPFVQVDTRLYGVYGIPFLVLLFLLKTPGLFKAAVLSAAVGFGIYFRASLPFALNLFEVRTVQALYREPHRFGFLVEGGDGSYLYRNKAAFDTSQYRRDAVGRGAVLQVRALDRHQVESFYVKSYLAGDLAAVVFNLKTYGKYVLKELPGDFYENMRSFSSWAGKKSWLIPYEIFQSLDGTRYFIAAKFEYGQSFENYFEQFHPDYVSGINEEELLEKVIAVAVMSRDLNRIGWINRDIHPRNILVTASGLKMVDYDFIFPLDGSPQVMDSFGFFHHLHDIYALLFPKAYYEETRQEKFRYLPHENIPFKIRADIRNENLSYIKNKIYDNSYFYERECRRGMDFERAMELLIQDLKNLDKKDFAKPGSSNPKKGLVRHAEFQSTCVIQKTFFNSGGGKSFTIFHLPGSLAPYNYIELHRGFQVSDLELPLNRELARSLQETAQKNYVIPQLSKARQRGVESKLQSLLGYRVFILRE